MILKIIQNCLYNKNNKFILLNYKNMLLIIKLNNNGLNFSKFKIILQNE